MAKMMLRRALSEDRLNCTIELHMDGKALGHINLDASSLEGFIHDLGKARAEMAEQVAPTLDAGSRVEAIVDPGWRIPNDTKEDHRLLALRHPGLGWVSFLLPLTTSKEIAQWLAKDRVE